VPWIIRPFACLAWDSIAFRAPAPCVIRAAWELYPNRVSSRIAAQGDWEIEPGAYIAYPFFAPFLPALQVSGPRIDPPLVWYPVLLLVFWWPVAFRNRKVAMRPGKPEERAGGFEAFIQGELFAL